MPLKISFVRNSTQTDGFRPRSGVPGCEHRIDEKDVMSFMARTQKWVMDHFYKTTMDQASKYDNPNANPPKKMRK